MNNAYSRQANNYSPLNNNYLFHVIIIILLNSIEKKRISYNSWTWSNLNYNLKNHRSALSE